MRVLLTAVCLLVPGVAFAASPPTAVVVAGVPAPGQAAVAGQLHEPFAVDVDKAGNLYIAQLAGGQVLKLDPQGQLTVFAGTGEKGFAGDGGPARQAQFNGMHHLALGPRGDLFVTDTWNCCVRKIDMTTGVITRFAGSGKKGFSGDGGPAAEADCGGIYCLAFDLPRDRLLLADLDNRRIRVVHLSRGTIETLAGNGQKGVPADGAAAKTSPLVDPRAVACDAAGTVYILERSGNALRAVDLKGRIRTVAGTGRKGPAADDVPALEATLNGPKHLCVDGHGDVLVADAENHVIRKLLVRSGRMIRVAGTGTPGTAGLGGPLSELQLNRPHGVLVDPQGIMYLCDSENHRLLKVPPASR